jgi:protein-disulfide isomerase
VAEQPDERRSSRREASSAQGSLSQANLGLYFLISLATAIAVVAAAAGINHAWPIFGKSGGQTINVVAQLTPGAQATPAAEATPKPVTIDAGDNPAKGPADAKVTIVEFSDFQCPYCGRFTTETLPQILSNYGDKVRFVFMNFPLTSIHPYAQKAAEAGECANEQGAFWQFHDLLFQNQTALTALLTPDAVAGLAKVVDSMKGYASQLGLDTAKFNDCLDSGRMADAVTADMTTAQTAATDAGLTRFGTPAFFINGNNLAGAQPYDVFKAAIDAALAAAQ